jgi:hypothetical protein
VLDAFLALACWPMRLPFSGAFAMAGTPNLSVVSALLRLFFISAKVHEHEVVGKEASPWQHVLIPLLTT